MSTKKASTIQSNYQKRCTENHKYWKLTTSSIYNFIATFLFFVFQNAYSINKLLQHFDKKLEQYLCEETLEMKE